MINIYIYICKFSPANRPSEKGRIVSLYTNFQRLPGQMTRIPKPEPVHSSFGGIRNPGFGPEKGER